MIYGEHLHAEEEDPHCRACGRRATVEVFDAHKQSCGCYCVRCGKRKLKALKKGTP